MLAHRSVNGLIILEWYDHSHNRNRVEGRLANDV